MAASYVPPHKRQGFQPSQPTEGPKDPPSVTYLKNSKWTKGAGGRYYYPNDHPHVDLFHTRAGWCMAYSEGRQHLGGRGVLIRNGRELRDYAWAIGKLQTKWGDSFDSTVVNNTVTAMANW